MVAIQSSSPLLFTSWGPFTGVHITACLMCTPLIGGGNPVAGSSLIGSRSKRTLGCSEGTSAKEVNKQGKMPDPQGRILALLIEETVALIHNSASWLWKSRFKSKLRSKVIDARCT